MFRRHYRATSTTTRVNNPDIDFIAIRFRLQTVIFTSHSIKSNGDIDLPSISKCALLDERVGFHGMRARCNTEFIG